MKKTFATIPKSSLPNQLLFTLVLLLFIFSSCLPEETNEINSAQRLMGSGYGIHSSTIIVKDLEKAQNYFSETLGFFIPPKRGVKGTNHPGIPFPDGSMLELMPDSDSVKASNKVSLITASEEKKGIQIYSLSSSSVDSTHSWLISRGFNMDSIISYRISDKTPEGWSSDDGSPQIYKASFDRQNQSSYLPEFVELSGFPYERMGEWRSFYHMQRTFYNHKNGVVGITALQVVVEDLKSARKEFLRMGLLELEENKTENSTSFRLKRNQELQLKTPISSDDEYSQFLQNHGSGVFAIKFEVKDINATHDFLKESVGEEGLLFDSLSEELTVLKDFGYGIQLEFHQESDEQSMMAEKLSLSFTSKLDSSASLNAEHLYQKYCALCHGKDREGGAADFAPSLRSHSLMGSAQKTNFLRYTIQYGRTGTAMAGFYKNVGGPLEYIEIELLLKWLKEESGVEKPVELSREPVNGDIALGSKIYAQKCVACHGENGEGITAPALGNPMLLATATDHFLRYAISEGRDGTAMPSFKDSLKDNEIDAVTAFLRSRASGWDVPEVDSVKIPLPENYVLNPGNKNPNFELREGRYLPAEQLHQALKDSARIVLLDARSTVAWRQMHIPGAIPVPHYEEPEAFIDHIPNDSTWVVAYCACPHAASGKVINTLRRYGFKNTAILDEGILVWAQEGYPVQNGQ